MFDKDRKTPLNFKLPFYFTVVNIISLNIFERSRDNVHAVLILLETFLSA